MRQNRQSSADKSASGDGRDAVLFDRGDLGLAVAVGAVTLVIYWCTLAPGLLQDDSAEMQTLAVTLGYAHPTGYPVYLLTAKLAAMVPLGEAAYRVNLFSAAMGALAAGLVYLLGRLLCGGRWTAAAGAVALAVSPTLWSQAIVAEVYTSGVVCTVGVLLWLELWRQRGRLGWLFAAGCLGGVSLGVHATVSLMAPAAVLLLAIAPRRRTANWVTAAAGALTGTAITLAAFAVIDRAAGPASYFRTVIGPSRSVWGLQPEDLDGFLDRVRLSMSPPQFAELLTSQPRAVTRQKAVQYTDNLAREFPLPWLLLAIVGLFWLGRRNAPMTLVLAMTYVTHLCYDLQFDGVVHVMYISTYVPMAVLGIAGLAALGQACGDWATWPGRQPGAWMHDRLPAVLGLAIVLWPLLWADAWKDGRRRFWLPPGEQDAFRVADSAKFHRRVRRLIAELEPDALVFTGWCTLYPYYYVAHLEQPPRTDLDFIQYDPQRDQQELADSALQLIIQVSPRRPVYFTVPADYFAGPGKKVAEVFELRPVRCGGETLYRLGERNRLQGQRGGRRLSEEKGEG